MTERRHAADTVSAVWDIVTEPGNSSREGTVRVSGEVDLTTTPLLARALHDQLSQGRNLVRLDTSAVTFLDCAGLRALVLAHNEFLHAGGALVLYGLTARTWRLLRLAHLDEAFFVVQASGVPRKNRHLRSVSDVMATS